uniref:Transposable element P transposase-like RNase H C-terminal domain-containing protein n=1 Tax=Anopheles dirus TaxID=7168 RepID=A0A182N2X7_9DIPT
MIVVGKQKMQIFQRSILMQITSMRMLFNDMKEKHHISYISTYKLNQDLLENFFSQLRQTGGAYDHPSRRSCIHRIRLMILGWSPTCLKNVTNNPDNNESDVYATSTQN